MDIEIKVITYLETNKEKEFNRLKRHKWDTSTFTIWGEWSQSMFNQGYVTFEVVHTSDRKNWALKSIGFPTRIVAVAEASENCTLEQVTGIMMGVLAGQGGEYIDMVHNYSDNIDDDELWRCAEVYSEKERENRNKK